MASNDEVLEAIASLKAHSDKMFLAQDSQFSALSYLLEQQTRRLDEQVKLIDRLLLRNHQLHMESLKRGR